MSQEPNAPPWWYGERSGAVISTCGLYRYALWRKWDPELFSTRILEWLVFVMLNPSTADAQLDDNTIRKLIAYAKTWGFNNLLVVNLFAFRATDPEDMKRAADPVGPENDAWIERAVAQRPHAPTQVVCAWGKHGEQRGLDVAARLRAVCKPMKLKLNGDGSPAHPLYLPGTLQPTVWT